MSTSPTATRASIVTGERGARSTFTSTLPIATWTRSLQPPAPPATWIVSSPNSVVGSTPMRAASPATNPEPAKATAGITSQRARPANAPTTSPTPHTTAAAPSHCSGCRRPPFAWSMRAPTAATSTATPSVRRPRIDGGRGAHRWGASLDAPSAGEGDGGWRRPAGGGGRRAGLPEGDGQAGEEGEHGERPVEEVESVGQDQRQTGDQQHAARDARPLLRRAADEQQPQRPVHQDADATDQCQQDEGDADPEGVHTEASGEQGGDATDDGLRRAQLVTRCFGRIVEQRSAVGRRWGEVHDIDGTSVPAIAPSGMSLLDP